MRRTSDGVFLVLIAAGAIALAAATQLHHDLAIDEPFTALAVADPASLRKTFVHDNAPLFYALLLTWTRIFGASAFALRAMSLAAFGGAIVFTAAAAKRVSSSRAAWLTAILAGSSIAFGIQPAATVRPYALAMLCAAMALWASVRVNDSTRIGGAGALLTSHLLGLFTHPMFAFVSAASAVAGLTARGRRRLVLSGIPAVALGIYLIVWWPVVRQTIALPIRTWMTQPGPGDLLRGTLFWGDHSTPLLALSLALLIAFRRSKLPAGRVMALAFPLAIAVLVLAGAYLASSITPVYLPARTPVFVLPSIALVFGVAIADMAPAAIGIAAALLVVTSAVRYTVRTAREPDPFPTRASLATIASNATCGDTIVAAGLSYASIVYYKASLPTLPCIAVVGFPREVAAHPGWLDLSEGALREIPASAAAFAASLPRDGTVWVFAETRGIGRIHSDALVRALSTRDSRPKILPLKGSFFTEVAAFSPAKPPAY